MADDWVKLGVSVGASLISGAAGMIAGVWRAGRDSSKREQSVKDDYDAKIKALGDEMRKALADHERASESRLDLLVGQFQESFTGLRRQVDSARLEVEREFLRKEDFRDFRDEYRKDIREIKDKIDGINRE
jgi:hypothetical protein